MGQRSGTVELLKYACTVDELSCIIGNVFAELRPPCGLCRCGQLVICGTTVTGEEATLIVTEFGFDFDGDPDLIDKIRQRRCNNEQTTEQAAKRAEHHHQG